MNDLHTIPGEPRAGAVAWYGWYWLATALVVLANTFGLRPTWSLLTLLPFVMLISGWVRRPEQLVASERQLPTAIAVALVVSLVVAVVGVIAEPDAAGPWRTVATSGPALPCLAMAYWHFRTPPPPR